MSPRRRKIILAMAHALRHERETTERIYGRPDGEISSQGSLLALIACELHMALVKIKAHEEALLFANEAAIRTDRKGAP